MTPLIKRIRRRESLILDLEVVKVLLVVKLNENGTRTSEIFDLIDGLTFNDESWDFDFKYSVNGNIVKDTYSLDEENIEFFSVEYLENSIHYLKGDN